MKEDQIYQENGSKKYPSRERAKMNEYQREYYQRHREEILRKRKETYDPEKQKEYTEHYWRNRLERMKQAQEGADHAV